uniref:Uncharacterized protein n=1 Tax=Plectus sambesii TaxID=2011161 RepID=A0A914VXQ5_9BILA
MGAEQTPPTILGQAKINKHIDKKPCEIKKDYYIPAVLPKWEIAIYFLVWSGHTLASFIIADNASQIYKNRFYHFLTNSSYVDDQLYDTSDTEWILFKEGMRDFLPSMIGHFLLFNFGHQFIPKVLMRWVQIGYWICMHIYLTNLTSVCFILVAAPCAALITSVFRHALPVWVLAVGFVLKANDIAPYVHYSTVIYYRQFNLYLYTAVQVINFCSYLAKNRHVRLVDALPRFIEYLFYPPYSVTLIVLYEDFDRQMTEREFRKREPIGQLAIRLIRLVFWFFFVEAFLHRIFVNAIFVSPSSVISRMGTYSISAVAFLAGQYFHVKYVLIFGLPAFFAYLDNMTPPGPPICISRVSKYAQMWRYFDRGLYEFLKIQVYLPLIGQKFSPWRKLGAMVVAFGFVLAWHGTSSKYLWWVLISATEIVVERVGAAIYSRQVFQ